MQAKARRRLRQAPLLFPLLFLGLFPWSGSVPAQTCSAVSSPMNVRVSILSKYSPKEITVKGAEGMLFADNAQVQAGQGGEEAAAKGKPYCGRTTSFKTEGREIRISCNDKTLKAEIKGQKTITANRLMLSFPKRYVLNLKSEGVQRTLSKHLIIGAAGSLQLIALLDTETYVAAAARSELGSLIAEKSLAKAADRWQRELISAQETAIRSWITAQKSRHITEEYDLCDLTHCIHFAGLPAKEVYAANPGRLMYDGQNNTVNAYFHSTCGGALAGPEVYWRSSRGSKCFRRGADSEGGEIWCKASPHASWSTVLSFKEMNELTGMADVVSAAPEYRQGRVSSLTCSASYGEKRLISVSSFLSKAGKTLGWSRIKSNMFTIEKSGNGWILQGHGLGHGTGMCQWGAAAQAQAGKTAAEILAFYYDSPLISN